MTRTKWAALALGVGIFLSAFGAALAVTVFQVSREIPSTLRVSSVVVLSGDSLGLWHDQGKTLPVTSLEFVAVQFQPPLDSHSTRPEVWIYIENRSTTTHLTLIAPCHGVEDPPGTRIGEV